MNDRAVGSDRVLAESFVQRDELLRLLCLADIVGQRATAGSLSAEERQTIEVLRGKLARHVEPLRRRLQLTLLKVELFRRRLEERPPAGKLDRKGAWASLLVRRIQVAAIREAQIARAAAARAARDEAPGRDNAEAGSSTAPASEGGGASELARRAAVVGLAAYLADVKSTQPAQVHARLRNELAEQVDRIRRFEGALRTLDGVLAGADAEAGGNASGAEVGSPAADAAASARPGTKRSRRAAAARSAARSRRRRQESVSQPSSEQLPSAVEEE